MLENIKLYATSTAHRLGEQIATHLGQPLYKTHTEKFSDGELFVRFNESIRGQTLFIVAKIHMPYENLFELLLTVDAARRSSAKEVILVLPYLPHSRQERRDGQRTSISSRIVADLVQQMGADRIITIDLHTNAIEGFYKIPLDPLSSHRLFIESILSGNTNHLCLCSPDFGGIRRLKEYKKQIDADIVVINKERLKPNQVAHMEIIGEVRDKHVTIIDDVIDTAGTLCKAADLLIEHGASSVNAYCTHGILSGNALSTIRNSKIDHICISDTVVDHLDDSKIRMISCSKLLARAIENLVGNKSLSQL